MINEPDQELQDAYNECCRAHNTGRKPCYDPAYLQARRRYHRLLVERGLLERHQADEGTFPDYLNITKDICERRG